MNILDQTGLVLALLATPLVLQVLWTLFNPPLLHKPGTWFVHWSLKANLALAPTLIGLSLV